MLLQNIFFLPSETKATQAGLRHVFQHCDSGSAMDQISTFRQDLEPQTVVVDANNKAHIVFQVQRDSRDSKD